MLYVTTRGTRDAFTAHRTLCANKAPDNGYFIPMRFPQFSQDEVRSMVESSFEETVACILNLFFPAGLTKWDVGLFVGMNTARTIELSPKIVLAELWHNPGNCFDHVISGLFRRVIGKETNSAPSEWFCITVKIAILFGLYGELCRCNILSFGETIDLSLPADNFSYPIAAIYANTIGLPIGELLCNCSRTQEVWNLIHRGTLNISGLSDDLRAGLERFLFHRLKKAECILDMRSYEAEPNEKACLQSGLFCTVSGKERIVQAQKGVIGSNKKFVTPNAALCFSGLGDYRAKTGDCRLTMIIEEEQQVASSGK